MTIAGMAIIIAIGPYWAAPLHPSVSQISHVPESCAPCWHTSVAAALLSAHFRASAPVAKKKEEIFKFYRNITVKW